MTSGYPGAPELPSPSIARIYDYALGGKDNYESDRLVYEKIVEKYPHYRVSALANREFLRRSVAYCAERGIRQFVDLGSGIPTSPNVHEVARAVHPEARVVYVDKDETAFVHGRAWLSGLDGIEYVQHDIEDVDGLLASDALRATIDLDEQLAVLAFAVLHFMTDDTVAGMLAQLRRVTAPGSLLALSVAGAPRAKLVSAGLDKLADEVSQSWGGRIVTREPAEIEALLAGMPLVPPGLVDVQDWPEAHPEPVPDLFWLAAVAELHGA